jgi:hypothetical protein
LVDSANGAQDFRKFGGDTALTNIAHMLVTWKNAT